MKLIAFATLKKRTFEILETALPGDKASRAFDIFIISLIALNVLAVILETEKAIYSKAPIFFHLFEVISVIIFTIEYLLRIWSCTINENYRQPLFGRVKFALTPLALVDLFAILPFYIPMIIPLDLRFLRAIRLVRLFRLFKLGRYSEALKLFGRVLKAKKEELYITVFIVFLLLIIASSLLYFVEHEAQPNKFSSIPASMWWGVATLTTVGYGDTCPITPMGKFFASIISLLGIGLFALPAGILSSGFVEEIRKKRTKIICPYCGGKIG